jgi:hypothetical protein
MGRLVSVRDVSLFKRGHHEQSAKGRHRLQTLELFPRDQHCGFAAVASNHHLIASLRLIDHR